MQSNRLLNIKYKSDLIFEYDFPNQWKVEFYLKKLISIFKKLKLIPKSSQIVLSVSCVTADDIRKLNKKFRKIDSPTDILSFEQPKTQGAKQMLFLGDLVISKDILIKQAKQNRHTQIDELIILLTHGLLHLLGYDHEYSKKEAESMKKKEELVLKKFKVKSGLIRRTTV